MRRRWMGCLVLAGLCLGRSEAAFPDPFRVSASVYPDGTGWVAAVAFAVPERHHIYADELRVEEVGGAPLTPGSLPAPSRVRDAFTGQDRDVYARDFMLTYGVGVPVLTGITLRVEYQGCDDTTCFFPQSRLFPLLPGAAPSAVASPGVPAEVAAPVTWQALDAGLRRDRSAAGFLRPPELLAFLEQALRGREAGRGSHVSTWARIRGTAALFSESPEEFLRRFGAGWTVVLILLGGLLLNLTPCVLPMIPVNLAILGVGAQGSSRLRGFGLGAAYGTGIALVYGVLGLVVVLSGAQFGALNSLPWFNAVIAVVFAVLGLAMFDVIQIDLTRFQGGADGLLPRRGSYLAAAGMGGLAALLAGACVAPVVIAVLLLSGNLYGGGVTVGLLLPFVLGLGMALPWPLAGAGLAFIPKPGPWMTWVKYGFGVFIMALALYYAAVAARGWRGARDALPVAGGDLHVSADQGPAAWAPVLAQAQASGKPVFVDFWATWCKNCEAMELTTFKDPAVRESLAAFVVVKCQAERPTDPATRETLEHFGVKGLPTYVVLKPALAGAGPGTP